MRHLVLGLLVALVVISAVSSKAVDKTVDLLKRLDELEAEVDDMKRDLMSENEAENSDAELEAILKKRVASWRDPKRPMLHSDFKKKSLSQLDKPSDGELARLLARALLGDK